MSSEEYADGDQELDKYLVMLLGLQRLLNWERALMQEIIPNSKQSDVFAKLAYKSIDMVVKDAEAITHRIMRSISRKEWTSALGIFKTLKNVLLLQPDIDRTYDVQQREQLTKVINKLQYTVNNKLYIVLYFINLYSDFQKGVESFGAFLGSCSRRYHQHSGHECQYVGLC